MRGWKVAPHSSRCENGRNPPRPSTVAWHNIMFEEQLVTFEGSETLLNLVGAPILIDPVDFLGIRHAGQDLANDFGRVTRGNANPFQLVDEAELTAANTSTAIIIGCIESSWMLRELEKAGKIDFSAIKGRWESFLTAVVDNPVTGCSKALVIAGSDKRAAIFGAYTLSRQIGVSP